MPSRTPVHNLRGFLSLIERSPHTGGEQAALEGLKESIDQLERLALEALRPTNGGAAEETRDGSLREVVDATTRELSRCYPNVRCRVLWSDVEEGLRVSPGEAPGPRTP